MEGRDKVFNCTIHPRDFLSTYPCSRQGTISLIAPLSQLLCFQRTCVQKKERTRYLIHNSTKSCCFNILVVKRRDPIPTSRRDWGGPYNVIRKNVKAINMIPKMNKSSEITCHLIDENLLNNLTRVNRYQHHQRSLISGESRVAEQACRIFQVVDVENDEKYFHPGRKRPKMNTSSLITWPLD